MRNHTTAKFYELVSQQGKNPVVTPGSSPQAVQFLLNNIPTGKEGKFWYYAMSVILKVVVAINQPGSGGAALTDDQLWKVIQSVNLQCPILGQLATHQNTRGSVLGLIMQYFGFGFTRLPLQPVIGAATDTTVTLYYRLPLSYEFLRKPHETAPWGGFLEGGTFEVKLDVATVLDADSTGATLTSANFRAWLEMIPAPEAVLHTPVHWREHQVPGNSTKHIIQDFGSSDGLNGLDQSKGVGLAHLSYLMNPTGAGLAGSTTADNIISYDIPWRDQDRVDVPDAPFANLQAMLGANRINPSNTTLFGGGGQGGYPYSDSAATIGNLNAASAFVFPNVSCGRDTETSKLQTVAGAKEINYTFGSGGTPSGINRYLGLYFPVFDQQFMQILAQRIAPGKERDLVAKTLNKQVGGIHGVGKLAYTRAKVV